MIRIGVDLSSAEKDSVSLFSSVELFLKDNEDVNVNIFIEQSQKILFEQTYPNIPSRCKIIYTCDDIKMEDIPSSFLISRTESAMVQGLNNLHQNHIDAFFSPGNSGALLLLSKEIIQLRKSVSFPAIAIVLPRPDDFALLLDAGASFNFDEERILELIYLGKEYYKQMFRDYKPLVGLLNVGKERYKGSLTLKRTDRFLKKSLQENYSGFMEGMDIFKNPTNIFITDAYTGNILLKSWEGFLSYIFTFLQNQYPEEKNIENNQNHLENILSFLKENFHYSQIGAAPILGLKKPVFLGHGRTSHKALLGALRLMKTQLLNEPDQLPEYMKKRSKWAQQF